jgi:copper chaperone CopZ
MQPASLNTKQSTIHIRNMVCDSCVKVVRYELERTGFVKVDHVELGKAVIRYNEQVISIPLINEILQNSGFGIIDDRDDKLVEQIKQSIIQLIFFGARSVSMCLGRGL